MKIYSTMDYSKFKTLVGNRVVDHAKNVAKSIEKIDLTAYNPILVTDEFEILDGQNRFEACKMLDKPIYYLVCDSDIPAADIIRALNTTQRNWRMEDYVQSWVDLGNERMVDFVNWAYKYGFDDKHYGVAGKMYMGINRTPTSEMRDGTLLDKWDGADKLAEWICAVREKGVPFWTNSRFVDGAMAFFKTHTEKEMKKVLKHIDKIAQYGSGQAYVNRMQQIVDAVKVR